MRFVRKAVQTIASEGDNEMGNKFDLEAAQKLSEILIKTANTMEAESSKVQDNFTALGETFKDKGYSEFQSELNAADRTMASIVADIRELNRSILDYKNQMSELL